jgi:DNA-binding SARP family transcriptional activator
VGKVLRLTLFGGFEARFEAGPPVRLSRKKSEALLAYLALHAGQVQARDKLAALLWGDVPDRRARHSLRQALTDLRRATMRRGLPLLVEHGDAVAVDANAVDVDVLRFERLLGDGRPPALEQAVALYRGPVLEGLAITERPFEEWLRAERERLHDRAVESLARLLAHQGRVGPVDEAVRTATRLLSLDPVQESVHRTVMRLHTRQGRLGAALRQYQLCVGALERELGVGPEAETRQLYRELLQTSGLERRPPSDAPALGEAPASGTPLIGRQREVAQLRSALEEAWRGRGAVALVRGEAGVGKSRLVEALVQAALEAGGHVLGGRAYESEQILPFSPWIDALRAGHVVPHMLREINEPWRTELTRLFPDLGQGRPEPPAGDDYLRLFEAMGRMIHYLASGRPLLVVLEDLHWADEISHRLLAFLARRIGDWPVLMAGTLRDEVLPDVPPLRRSLAQLARQSGFVTLSLTPLSQAESLALVRALMPTSLGEPAITRVGEQLWRVSEGSRGLSARPRSTTW